MNVTLDLTFCLFVCLFVDYLTKLSQELILKDEEQTVVANIYGTILYSVSTPALEENFNLVTLQFDSISDSV
jgi:hypothetical protein